MAYTISTHNGSQVAREHNLRNRKVTAKEDHIRKDGKHETWYDIKPETAYKKIFGNAVRRYNEKQIASGHPERQIKNYYKKICQDGTKKKPVYEMIVSIGNYANHPDEKLCRKILWDFCKDWKNRNPNLIVVGCYYHADEALGAETNYGHVHIDYIPVAIGLTRGMDTQNALEKSFNQMGYTTDNMRNTAQIKWEKSENDVLEKICNSYGLEIIHPEIEHKKHLDIDEFRQLKRIKELENKVSDLEAMVSESEKKLSELEATNIELEEKNDKLEDLINALIDRHNELIDDIEELESESVETARDVLDRAERQIDRYQELSR